MQIVKETIENRMSDPTCWYKYELEMCQLDTDAPTQGPSSPGMKHLQKKNEVEKEP